MLAAQSTIADGGHVAWIDFEDSFESLLRRASKIGFGQARNTERFRFLRPVIYADETAVQDLAQLFLNEARGPSLVVIDSASSAGCPSDGTDVTEWYKTYVEPFTNRNIAVLLIDHIPKRSNDRPAGAIGSQYKLQILGGVGLSVSGRAWTGHENGRITLTLDKDKHGQVPAKQGERVAIVTGEWQGDVLRLTIEAPTASDNGVPVRNRVLDTIAATEGGIRGQKTLRELVKCNGKALNDALRELEETEAITVTKEGKANRYQLGTPETIETE